MLPFEHEPRFRAAIEAFDALNAQDPKAIEVDGVKIPYELFYAKELYAKVLQLCPTASETLLLAARSQHLCRWSIPRSSYEMDRTGYLRWRTELKKFHAQKSSEVLNAQGYPAEFIEQVMLLNLKKNLGTDPACQTLEDALCLMTLHYQLEDLIQKTAREKLIGILQKTWKKMSEQGRAAALEIPFTAVQKELLQEALQG